MQPAGATIGDHAIVATSIDHEWIARVGGLQTYRQAIRWIVVEIGKTLETGLRVGRQRRLRMRSKQLILALPKSFQRIRPFEPVEIADAAAPISEVDVMLGSAVSQRFLA